MMTHDDILRQIPDYVLGLLTPSQLSVVEQHVAHCTTCQQMLGRERKLSQLVRSTVNVATKPDTTHLRTLMPAIPKQRSAGLGLSGWQRQLAPAILIILLLLGGFMLNQMLPAGSVPNFVATAYAATATSTHTPTATVAQSLPEKLQINHISNSRDSKAQNAAVPIPSPSFGHPLVTPDPLPTPAAAIMQNAAH